MEHDEFNPEEVCRLMQEEIERQAEEWKQEILAQWGGTNEHEYSLTQTPKAKHLRRL